MSSNSQIPEEFDGWYFEHGYFCTPEGDRYSPQCLRACFFIRQSSSFSHLMNWRPAQSQFDSIMHSYVGLQKSPGKFLGIDGACGAAQARRQESPARARAPSSNLDTLALSEESVHESDSEAVGRLNFVISGNASC